jgi:hypothetical protein
MVGTLSDSESRKALSGLGSLQRRVVKIFASMTPAVNRRLVQLILERTVGNPGSFGFVDLDKYGTDIWPPLSPKDTKSYDSSDIDTTDCRNSCIPITFLGLSSRVLHSLQESGIRSVNALTKFSEQDLSGIEGVGKKAIEEITERIAEKGLFLMVWANGVRDEERFGEDVEHHEEIRLRSLRYAKREFADREAGRPDIPRDQYWLGTPGGRSFIEMFGRQPSKSEVSGLGKALDRLQERGVLLHSDRRILGKGKGRKTWQIRLTPLGVEVAAQLLRAEIFAP